MRSTSIPIDSSSGSFNEREAASTESASIKTPASFEKGMGPGYLKMFSLMNFSGKFFQKRLVKIIYPGIAMVGTYKVDHYLGQVGLAGHFNTLAYVPDDDLGAFFVRQLIVRVKARALVLNKEQRVLHFTNIMIQSPCPNQ
jgi:hypothetical protein